jgi:hypothetical protein
MVLRAPETAFRALVTVDWGCSKPPQRLLVGLLTAGLLKARSVPPSGWCRVVYIAAANMLSLMAISVPQSNQLFSRSGTRGSPCSLFAKASRSGKGAIQQFHRVIDGDPGFAL